MVGAREAVAFDNVRLVILVVDHGTSKSAMITVAHFFYWENINSIG
jgi:hypothetical protein